jgi:hypothetical protein
MDGEQDRREKAAGRRRSYPFDAILIGFAFEARFAARER